MLFFIDESGIDNTSAPYEVLAAAAIRENQLWDFVKTERELEKEFFGVQLASHRAELKGSKLLSKKRFRFAQQRIDLTNEEQRIQAQSCLEKGQREAEGSLEHITAKELTALGRASVQFVDKLLDLASAFDIKVFACMVEPNAPAPSTKEKLRKDYVYLFERMYYFLEDQKDEQQGIIVFDELEKAKARLLIDQVSNYFIRSAKGRERSRRIVPEPFFVHSDLTTVVQLSDIVAYVINWGFRVGGRMIQPVRTEIEPYALKISGMQYRGIRVDEGGNSRIIYGITCINDLRGAEERI